jgi:hypothetical protein
VVNDEALEIEAKDNPELLTILRRHMMVKTPSFKVTTNKVKNDDGNKK